MRGLEKRGRGGRQQEKPDHRGEDRSFENAFRRAGAARVVDQKRLHCLEPSISLSHMTLEGMWPGHLA